MARKAGGGVQFRIKNIKQIKRAFLLLEVKLAKKIIRQVLREANKRFFKPAVEGNAPVDSGDLKSSVKVRGKTKRGTIAVNTQIGEGNFKGDTYYAAMVEFGTSSQPPQGYMRRAFDAVKDRAAKWIEMELAKRIDKEIRRLRRS